MFGSSLLAFGALPLLMVPMTTEFGWSQPAFAGAVSCLMIFGACSGPFVGHHVDRAGAKPAILVGTLVVGLATLSLAGLAGSLAHFYLAHAVMGVFGSTGLGYVKIIGVYFRRNRAKALALFGAEATVAGAFTPLIVHAILGQHGWRAVYLVLGITVLVMVPFQLLLLPGPERERRAGPARASGAEGGVAACVARRSATYWLLIAAIVLAAAPRLGLITFIVPILSRRGFDAGTAAWAIACMTIAAPIGSLIAGAVMDRFGTPRAATPLFAAALAATVLLACVSRETGGMVGLIAASVLFGLTLQVHVPILGYFQTRYFGLRFFTENYGLAVAILGIGIGAVTPLLGLGMSPSGNAVLALVGGGLVASILIVQRLRRFPVEAVAATS